MLTGSANLLVRPGCGVEPVHITVMEVDGVRLI